MHKIDPPDSADVPSLMWSLRKTLDYEDEAFRKFESTDEFENGKDGKQIYSKVGDHVGLKSPKKTELHIPSDQGTKLSSGEKMDSMAENLDEDGFELPDSYVEAVTDARSLPSVKGVVANVFEPYLIAYVNLEATKMNKELNQAIRDENVENDGTLRLTSSSQMFLLIRKSINRCIQFTTGQAFYQLYCEFKKILLDYSQMLRSKLLKHVRPPSRLSVSIACFVCNASEYCHETIPQLQDLVKTKINNAFAEAIDMEDLLTAFSGVLIGSIENLVNEIHAAVDSDMENFSNTNWVLFKDVGDQSEYISTLSTVLREHAPCIREQLSHITWYHKFCSMFAEKFIARFKAMVFSSRQVSEAGAQQLLLDVKALRSVLLMLPRLGTTNAESNSLNSSSTEKGSDTSSRRPTDVAVAVYVKYVSTEMDQLEGLIKLCGLSKSPDLLVEYFKTVLKGGTTKSLQLVLQMIGLNMVEQERTIQLALDSGVPPEPDDVPSIDAQKISSVASSSSDTYERSTAAHSGTSFTNVFSSMSGMRETLGQVVGGSSTSKGLTTLGATFAQSYNRAVSKTKMAE